MKHKNVWLFFPILILTISFASIILLSIIPNNLGKIRGLNSIPQSSDTLFNYTMQIGASYEWIDPTSGTNLNLGDDGTYTHPLPFSFSMYDSTFSTVYISSNGWISFGNTNPSSYSGTQFPSNNIQFNYSIAAYWNDLDTIENNLYIFDSSSYCVIAWIDVSYLNSEICGTFEIILYPSGGIKLQYDYINSTLWGYSTGLNYRDGRTGNNYHSFTTSTNDFALYFSNPYSLPPNIAPEINQPADITYEFNTPNQNIIWRIEDNTNDHANYSIYQNGTNIINGSWTSSINIIVSIDGLSPEIYNYTIFAIDGRGANVTDTVFVYILTNLPARITSSGDMLLWKGFTSKQIRWKIIDYNYTNPNYTINRDGSWQKSGTWVNEDWISLTIDGLDLGTYSFTIKVWDGAEYSENTLIVTIKVNIAPQITSPIDGQIIQGTKKSNITWIPTDEIVNIPRYRILQNGTEIANGTWSRNTPIILWLENMTAGNYEFTIIIHDGIDGEVQDTVLVSIIPSKNSNPINYGLIIGGVVGGVAVIGGGIGYTINKRKKLR